MDLRREQARWWVEVRRAEGPCPQEVLQDPNGRGGKRVTPSRLSPPAPPQLSGQKVPGLCSASGVGGGGSLPDLYLLHTPRVATHPPESLVPGTRLLRARGAGGGGAAPLLSRDATPGQGLQPELRLWAGPCPAGPQRRSSTWPQHSVDKGMASLLFGTWKMWSCRQFNGQLY